METHIYQMLGEMHKGVAMFKIYDERKPSIKEMQQYVGSVIKVVTLSNGDQMIINADEKPCNNEATRIAHEYESIGPDEFIIGNAMLLKGKARLE